MKVRTAAITLLSAASLLAGPSAPLFAQTRPAGTAQQDPAAAARSRFSEGVAFAKRMEWQRAYKAFAEAWALKEHPQIALNLGRAEIEIGKPREAIEHLRYCTSAMEAGDPDLRLAKEWLAEAEKKVGRVLIAADVAGADVLVSGKSEGRTPLAGPVLVNPGRNVIVVSKGERRSERSIDVEPGASVDVRLELPQEAAPPAETSAAQQPSSSLWKAVLIGGGAMTLVGVGLGATLGGLSLDRQAARDACSMDASGRACATSAEAERVALARGSFAGFLGGGLFAVGTATLLLVGPRSTRVAVLPAAGPTGAGITAIGSF